MSGNSLYYDAELEFDQLEKFNDKRQLSGSETNAIDAFSAWRSPAIPVALMGVTLLNLICTVCWKTYPVLSYKVHDRYT